MSNVKVGRKRLGPNGSVVRAVTVPISINGGVRHHNANDQDSLVGFATVLPDGEGLGYMGDIFPTAAALKQFVRDKVLS